MNEIADCIEHNVDEVRKDIVMILVQMLFITVRLRNCKAVKLAVRIIAFCKTGTQHARVSARLKGYSAAEQRLNTRD